jgi:hypothetical protein
VKTFILFFSFLFLSSAFASTKAQWKAGLYGRSTDDKFSSSKTVGAFALAKIDHQISDSLEAFFLGGIALETGSSSALFTNEFEPKSHFLLTEASISWNPWNPLSFRLGALDQSHHNSEILMAGGTFPALMGALNFENESWLMHFDAQGAILTGRTFSTRATGKENTPTLATQKIEAGYSRDGTQFLLRGAHFEFRNLTRGMAQDSRFYGNTISGIANASIFVYNYQGFEAGPEISIPLSKSFALDFGGSRVLNTKGPKGNNVGIHGFSEIRYESKEFSLAPRVEIYKNETDSVPAYFSSSEFGHNNRKGIGAAIKLSLPSVEIEVRARRSKLIEASTFQKDRFEYLELSVELPYAGF